MTWRRCFDSADVIVARLSSTERRKLASCGISEERRAASSSRFRRSANRCAASRDRELVMLPPARAAAQGRYPRCRGLQNPARGPASRRDAPSSSPPFRAGVPDGGAPFAASERSGSRGTFSLMMPTTPVRSRSRGSGRVIIVEVVVGVVRLGLGEPDFPCTRIRRARRAIDLIGRRWMTPGPGELGRHDRAHARARLRDRTGPASGGRSPLGAELREPPTRPGFPDRQGRALEKERSARRDFFGAAHQSRRSRRSPAPRRFSLPLLTFALKDGLPTWRRVLIDSLLGTVSEGRRDEERRLSHVARLGPRDAIPSRATSRERQTVSSNVS
jgi:hypothetical protein